MLFDHDAKVSGDSARFADLPHGRQPRGVRRLADGETVLGYCDRAMEPETYALRRCGRMRAAGYWPSPTAWAAVPPGHETTLTVVLSSGGRSPRWLTSASPGRAGSACGRLGEITDERTISDLVAVPAARGGALWHLDGGPDLRLIRACGFCGPMAVTCCAPADSARSSTTDRTFMYSLCAPHPPTRRPTDRRSRDPSQRVPVDPVPL